MKLVRRWSLLSPSQTVGMAEIVMGLTRSGKDVIALNDGELEWDTPLPIIQGTIAALQRGLTKYSILNGEPELRQAISDELTCERHASVHPDDILITNGSKQAIYEVIHTVIDDGDEVIIPIPCWPTYVDVVKLAGGTPVLVRTEGIDLDIESIVRAITADTRLVIVNSPNNPTGSVYSPSTLAALCNALRQTSAYLLSDEAYAGMTFDGVESKSVIALPEYDPERTIITRTFSKYYAMTGYRIGYVYAHPTLLDKLSALHSHMTDNVCTFAQYGAIAALQMDNSFFQSWLVQLAEKRDLAVSYARKVFSCPIPSGAMYILPDVTAHLSPTIRTSAQLTELILRECGVAAVPGEMFYAPGRIRFCFGASSNAVEEAFRRVVRFLS